MASPASNYSSIKLLQHQTTQDEDKSAFTELVKHPPPPVTYSSATHSHVAREPVHLEKIIDLTRFSTKKRVVRVTATVLRFIKRTQRKRLEYPPQLEAEELREGERLRIQFRTVHLKTNYYV